MATPRAALAIVAWAALSGAGCKTPETGILIEVGAPPLRPDRLVFTIGSKGSGGVFVKDPESSVDAQVANRNLADDPYRLLVHEGTSGETMSGTVVAMSGTQSVGFAAIADVPFVSEKVLVYRLTLADDPSVVLTATGCVSWTDAGGARHAAQKA